jgi:hypothetical protein
MKLSCQRPGFQTSNYDTKLSKYLCSLMSTQHLHNKKKILRAFKIYITEGQLRFRFLMAVVKSAFIERKEQTLVTGQALPPTITKVYVPYMYLFI